jgi:tRNA 2-selenouridine synthase
MAVLKLSIIEFVQHTENQLIIDVRSPLEFAQAAIPGAISLPLFNNEERAIVGTIYKKQSKENAIKIALPFFGNKMLHMVNQVEQWVNDFKVKHACTQPSIVLYCWRGGMRSSAVAWLLDMYGFKVYQLNGGYKSFRKWINDQLTIPFEFRVVGGYTGSGKTEILHALQLMGENIIDLEAFANHKGSAFGAIGQQPQPSQEMFENLVGCALASFANHQKCIWIEDESQRIGTVMIPNSLFTTIRNSVCYFLTIPFENRLAFILQQYGNFSKETLISATLRIQKRLGGLETKNTLQFLEAENMVDAFSILLRYYDKWYEKFSKPTTHPNLQIVKIASQKVDATINARLLLALV